MTTLFTILLALISTVSLAAVLICFALLAISPGRLVQLSEKIEAAPQWLGLVAVLYLWAVFILFFFSAAYAFLWWLPSSWGWVPEDGSYTTLRVYVAGVIGMVFGFPAQGVLHRMAQQLDQARSAAKR